jgi:NADPH:quinone reductase
VSDAAWGKIAQAREERSDDIVRAMVTPRFGGTDLFEERDVERPEPGAGEVLVRVVAAGTNPVDAKFRAEGDSVGLEAPIVLGADISGVVEEIGPGVTDLAPGDEVYYTPEVFGPRSNGAYAEYHAARADIVARKPSTLSHEEAAAVPLAGGTAYEAVVRRLALRVGETVLVHGGAGGVGSFAIQIAKAAGARVLATAGPDNQEVLKALGADVTINYQSQDAAEIALGQTGGQGMDAVFDAVGGETVVESIPATKPFGRLATILGAQGDLTPLYQKNQTLHGVFLTRERARLEELGTLIERGQVRPLVAEVLQLEEVGKVHERLDSGHGRGKVVLRVTEEYRG